MGIMQYTDMILLPISHWVVVVCNIDPDYFSI